jgi:hypothetical protein
LTAGRRMAESSCCFLRGVHGSSGVMRVTASAGVDNFLAKTVVYPYLAAVNGVGEVELGSCLIYPPMP